MPGVDGEGGGEDVAGRQNIQTLQELIGQADFTRSLQTHSTRRTHVTQLSIQISLLPVVPSNVFQDYVCHLTGQAK